MFSYSSSDAVIPSLVFTKAELAYALSVLTAEIAPDDNSTGIEMVELRHYLNLIKDRVAIAASDGSLRSAVGPLPKKEAAAGNDDGKPFPAPSMVDLRREFPHLSDREIMEVLEGVRKSNGKEEERKEQREEAPTLPPMPSFVAKPKGKAPMAAVNPPTKEEESNAENSEKFARMLGSF